MSTDKTEFAVPYYGAYERRYRTVHDAGVKFWGHSPDDKELSSALERWVGENSLRGKRVIEYACGEGASGVILSRLGCVYTGIDFAPSAVLRAQKVLADFPGAKVIRLDMVNERVGEVFDAALDVMGFHMLVTDADRAVYLANVRASLAHGAPALFFRQCYRTDVYEGAVESYEEWKRITGSDYDTPEPRTVVNDGVEYKVEIPLVPARAKNKAGFIEEFERAGFEVENFIEMDINNQCPNSASIYVRLK
jgi:hypothetical protein